MSYKMWWSRDRILYTGCSVDQQRTKLLKRAGLNPDKVLSAVRLAQSWPANVHYVIKGGGNNQSYVKYLLAPAIPSGSGDYRVVLGPDAVSAVPSGEKASPVAPGVRTSWVGWICSLLLVSGMGYGFSRCPRITRISFPEQVALAVLLGCILIILSRVGFGSGGPGMQISAFVGGTGCLWFGIDMFRKLKSRGESGLSSGHGAELDRESPELSMILRGWIPACSLVLILSVILCWNLSTVVVPDDWDAWAIWGPKAKVLALGAGSLADVTYFGHADYPLLWPSVWAFSGWCYGGWEEQWSRAWGAVFLLLAAWQTGVVVLRVTGRRDLAFLSSAVFASIPKVVVVASWSYAEAPLWLMMICSFGRLLTAVQEDRKSDFLLAGCFAFAAAMTKNEGLMFAALGLVWLFVSCGYRKWRRVLWFAAPLIGYLPWLWWVRVQLELGTHAAEGLSLGRATLLHAWARLCPAFLKAIQIWGDFRQWSVVLYLLLAGMVLLLWKGGNRVRLALSFPLTMMMVLFIVEVFHSADLQWQLGASWDRMTIQVLVLLIPVVISAIDQGVLDKEG